METESYPYYLFPINELHEVKTTKETVSLKLLM